MRTLLSLVVLLSVAFPAFADGELNPLPEPESLALMAIAAVALWVTRRSKK